MCTNVLVLQKGYHREEKIQHHRFYVSPSPASCSSVWISPATPWSKEGWEGMLDCWVELRCLHHPSSTCATPGGFHKPAASTTPNAWGPFTDPTGAPTPHMIQTGFHANICPKNFSLIPTYGFHGPFKRFLLFVASGILLLHVRSGVLVLPIPTLPTSRLDSHAHFGPPKGHV